MMYQWASIILIPQCPRSLNLPDLRNRLILPDPAVELRQVGKTNSVRHGRPASGIGQAVMNETWPISFKSQPMQNAEIRGMMKIRCAAPCTYS